MPLEGQHLGPYRLLHLLGSGGMGEVYLAEDARIGQQVAIKVIRSEGIDYPESESARESARLFEREARAIARLDHPNILPLYAYGEEKLHDTLLAYLVMPYRKEGTLATWLRQRGRATPLAPAEVAPLLHQAAGALQHAHNHHVLHQDIKPSNFLIRVREDHPDRPDLLLSDFGIAKLTSATASVSQSIRGTPTYMAPEQWDGHPVAASDQYALAIMVYELLVGHPPFQGGPGQVMRQHYMTTPAAPSSLNKRLSPAIDAVLLRALAKQPQERFASVTDFARAFEEAMGSDGELHATLAISRSEAERGTTRTLSLPGGRRVSITVPAGVEDGTSMRLDGQGMPYYAGGPAGPLVLTLTVSSEPEPLPISREGTEPTFASSLSQTALPVSQNTSTPPAYPEEASDREPTLPAFSESEVAPVGSATPVTAWPTKLATPAPSTRPTDTAPSSPPPARPPGVPGTGKTANPVTSQRLVRVGLAGLLLVALLGGIAWFTAHQAPPAGSVTAHRSPPAGIVNEFPVSTPNSLPYDIAAGSDGNLWFTDNGNQKIGRITPSGRVDEFPVPTAHSQLAGITAGPDGNLWFLDNSFSIFGGIGDQIGHITPSGIVKELPLPGGNMQNDQLADITAGPDGNLWFIEQNARQIGRITPSGKVKEFPDPTASSYLYGIAAGADGNLWFTDDGNHKIGRITPSGSTKEFPFLTPNSQLGDITAGPDGNLWFTESVSNKIGRITPSGSVKEFPVPTPNRNLTSIAAGPDHNLWFTEYEGNKIGRITPSGSVKEFPVPTTNS